MLWLGTIARALSGVISDEESEHDDSYLVAGAVYTAALNCPKRQNSRSWVFTSPVACHTARGLRNTNHETARVVNKDILQRRGSGGILLFVFRTHVTRSLCSRRTSSDTRASKHVCYCTTLSANKHEQKRWYGSALVPFSPAGSLSSTLYILAKMKRNIVIATVLLVGGALIAWLICA